MRKKIFWTLQCIVTAIMLVYAVFTLQIFYDKMIFDNVESLSVQVEKIGVSAYTTTDAKALSKRLSANRITIFSLDGKLLSDSDFEEISGGIDEECEEFKNALIFGQGYSVKIDETDGTNKLFYCKKLSFAEGEGVLRILLPLKTPIETFTNMLPTLIWFILLVLLLCMLAAYLGTEFIISPVKRIAKDASLNLKVDTKYSELLPIVEILNKRNEEVSRQMREISEEKELVVRAQKSKNDFIANITHEMNTPLTSIRGYSELIANGAFNEVETRQAAEILVKQSERLTKLIARIINYSELDNDDLPSYGVDLSVALNDCLETLAPSIKKKGIELEAKVEDGIIVQSRQERINEILGNLLRNSIRYNKENGKLTVLLQVENSRPRLTISDTGIGITEENLERIFDRFFTVDKAHNGQGGGFGLGLAVVKKICKRAGWEIRVQSKLGEGTTFTIDFIQ